jgi:hypothetical protein
MTGSWRSVPLPPGWPGIRAAVLMRDPVCRWGMLPEEAGRCSSAATEADHIGDPSDHRLTMLRGICGPHHIVRSTGQARAVLAERRTLARRPEQPHPGYR